jgi:hypothetical protein
MPMYISKEGLILTAAFQFDPAKTVMIGVKPWPDEAGHQPRDMSWGYLDTDTGRQHVRVGDWIGKDREGNLYVYTNQTFLMNFSPYQEVSRMARLPDMTIHIDTTPEAQGWIAKLNEMASNLSEDRIRQIVRDELSQLMMKPAIQAPGWQQFEVK